MATKITTILILTATFAYSGLVGFLTQKARDWDFIQSVGGITVQYRISDGTTQPLGQVTLQAATKL